MIRRPRSPDALAMTEGTCEAMARGVHAVGLVHALQNHDEMTYELVHFASEHREEEFTFRGEPKPVAVPDTPPVALTGADEDGRRRQLGRGPAGRGGAFPFLLFSLFFLFFLFLIILFLIK